MPATAPLEDILRIVFTEHHDPFSVLGIHHLTTGGAEGLVIRTFIPGAREAFVLRADGEVPSAVRMEKVNPEGFFEAIFPGEEIFFPYRLRTIDHWNRAAEFHDSYAFPPTLTDFDLHLLSEGNHYRIYEKLGAHFAEIYGVAGIQFAVWAPNARSVSVIGSFNNWDRRRHAMRVLGSSGVWEIFIPGLVESALYKFEIKTRAGYVLDKTDPYATQMEKRPRTASVVNLLRDHAWGDADWMKARVEHDPLHGPLAIYEVHPGSWRRRAEQGGRPLTYREMAEELVPYVAEMGFTHVEFLPVMEHPFDGSWGYQVTGYYAPTSRFGTPQDFMRLVDAFHRRGIGVLLDWVPAHFPKDIHALNSFDGTHLYEHADPRMGEHQDWGTLIFNYGRNEVRNFLIANALFWLEMYHVDGLRIDAVASMLYLDYSREEGEWIPNRFGGRENLEAIDFLRQLNLAVHSYHPGAIVMAEESTAFTGVTHPPDANGLGFDLKWNMGWMHDTLEYFSKDPVHRKYHHDNLTFSLLYAFNEQFLLPLSHDEAVHGKGSLIGKMPGDYWQRFANMRLLLGCMYGHPGKKLLFMGAELGQWNEWSHDGQLDWNLTDFEAHRRLQQYVRDLNRLYRSEPAMHREDFNWTGFQWIDFSDAPASIISFRRIAPGDGEELIFLCNFTPVVHESYRLGAPAPGFYQELLNSDSEYYGGSNVGNGGGVTAEAVPFHNLPWSLLLRVPPLAVVVFKKTG